MKPHETARALLDWYRGDASRWTQYIMYRDAAGLPLDPIKQVLSGGPQRVSPACACISGALRLVNVVGADRHRFATALLDVVGARPSGTHTVGTTMVLWNDADERTFADVVAALELLAEQPL